MVVLLKVLDHFPVVSNHIAVSFFSFWKYHIASCYLILFCTLILYTLSGSNIATHSQFLVLTFKAIFIQLQYCTVKLHQELYCFLSSCLPFGRPAENMLSFGSFTAMKDRPSSSGVHQSDPLLLSKMAIPILSFHVPCCAL